MDNIYQSTAYEVAQVISEDHPEYTTYMRRLARDCAGLDISDYESRVFFEFCAADTINVVKPLLDLLTNPQINTILIDRTSGVEILVKVDDQDEYLSGSGKTIIEAAIDLLEEE